MILHIVLFVLVVFLGFSLLRRRRQVSLPLPPGPKGKFLVGNAWDLPKSHEWVTYDNWAKIYDPDITYLNLAGQGFVILNSFAAAEELLEHRSAIFSSRPRFPMISELMGWEYVFSLKKYGPMWRKHRKFIHQSFSPHGVSTFKPHLLKATHTFMRNLLARPEEYKRHIQHMASEALMLVTYGLQVLPENDPYVELPDKAIRSVSEALVPGRFLVDALPWLKYVPEWVPFAGFQRKAREWRRLAIEARDLPYLAAKNDILDGSHISSLVSIGLKAIEEKNGAVEEEDVIKHVAGTTYISGSDTTVSTILNGVLALMCYPNILKKAQAEVDTVVKPGKLPDFSDRESLPYISALVKEVMRWYPVSPLGMPHYNEVHDAYKGYRIPAGTIVSANIWGILHDETVYPDPDTFDPDRFLKDGKLNPDILDPEKIVFGFGRRICAGRHLASLSVWIIMAHLVALFDISKPVDEEGNIIEPILEWISSSNPCIHFPVLIRHLATLFDSHPLPYRCKIVPRSPEAAAVIARMAGYEYFNE